MEMPTRIPSVQRTRLHSAPLHSRLLPLSLLGLLLLSLLVLPSCSSNPKEDERKKRPRGPALEVDEETRPVLEESWKLYLSGDPAWPAARERWLDLGEAPRNVLIESMIREMTYGINRNQVSRMKRAETELVAIGAATVPI